MADDLFANMMAAAAQAINNNIALKLLVFFNATDNTFSLIPTNSIADMGVALMNPDNSPLFTISATDVAKFRDDQLMQAVAQNWYYYVENLHLNPMSTPLTAIADITLPEIN